MPEEDSVHPIEPIQPGQGPRPVRPTSLQGRWGAWRQALARREATRGNWQSPQSFEGDEEEKEPSSDGSQQAADRERRREMEREATPEGHRLDIDA